MRLLDLFSRRRAHRRTVDDFLTLLEQRGSGGMWLVSSGEDEAFALALVIDAQRLVVADDQRRRNMRGGYDLIGIP